MELASGALRALNSTFARKGIVATSADESASRALPADVLALLDALKGECQGVCENARDVASLLQLWKERSLHLTLEALDDVADAVDGGTKDAVAKASENSHEKQIQAIEMHDKSGREISDTLRRHRVAAASEVLDRVDAFARRLAAVLSKLIHPELEEELAREKAIVHRLVSEKQRLDQSQFALEEANRQLSARIDSLENAPDGGGDAVLCNKLRLRVRELSASKSELLASVESMEKERETHRWEMVQMCKELELQQRTFLLTKAMHEKETKQLVDLVQSRRSQFAHVMQAAGCDPFAGASGVQPSAASAKLKAVRPTTPLEVYDPVSGRTIQFAATSPPKKNCATSGLRSASTPVGGLPFAASPPQSPKRRLTGAAAPDSLNHRNQQQLHRASGWSSGIGAERTAADNALEGAGDPSRQQPPLTNAEPPQSPTGRVCRLVSSAPRGS